MREEIPPASDAGTRDKEKRRIASGGKEERDGDYCPKDGTKRNDEGISRQQGKVVGGAREWEA
jgi:hypothetical protein